MNLEEQKRKRLWEDDHALSQLATEAWRDVLKYLMASNSGGALAFLAFLGKPKVDVPDAWKPLMWFGLGVAFVGISLGINAFRCSHMSEKFARNLTKFHDNEISMEELVNMIKWPKGMRWTLLIMMSLSFLCFMMGLIVSFSILIRMR